MQATIPAAEAMPHRRCGPTNPVANSGVLCNAKMTHNSLDCGNLAQTC